METRPSKARKRGDFLSSSVDWRHNDVRTNTLMIVSYIDYDSWNMLLGNMYDLTIGLFGYVHWDINIEWYTGNCYPERHWTHLVIVKDQWVFLLGVSHHSWCIKKQTCENLNSVGHRSCRIINHIFVILPLQLWRPIESELSHGDSWNTLDCVIN